MQFRDVLAVALLLGSPGLLVGQGRGGFDPAEFIKRLDANGNGQIDPEESEGRAGYFLKRIAENDPDIDLSKPVPLERVEKAMAAARERWEVQRGGDERGRDGDRGRNRDDDGGRDRGRSIGSAKIEPLVPGFGVESTLAPVPGFGLLSAATAVIKITDDDRRDAERRFRYYDRNKDGVLDADEMRRARSGDYEEYDRNHDGQLTIDELAERYAKRRVAEEREREESSAAASSSSSSISSQRSGDGDRSPGGWFGRRDGDGDDRDRDSRDSRSRGTSNSSISTAGSVYRVASAEERLAKLGVPSWFRDGDENGDGQIAMAEFGGTLSESTLVEFARFDGNGDGLITPDECMLATKSGVSRGSSSSSASSRSGGSFSRSSAPAAKTPAVSSRSEDKSEKGEVAAAEVTATRAADESSAAEIDPQYLKFAQGRMEQLDTNGDGILRPEEWAESFKPVDAADTNGDKLITATELALFYMKK